MFALASDFGQATDHNHCFLDFVIGWEIYDSLISFRIKRPLFSTKKTYLGSLATKSSAFEFFH